MIVRMKAKNGEDLRKVVAAMEAAAHNLYEQINKHGHKGTVLTGNRELFVYIYGKWHGQKPKKYGGFPVTWRENVGMAEGNHAQANRL